MFSAKALADEVRRSAEHGVTARLRKAEETARREGGDLLGVFQQESAAVDFLGAVQTHARMTGTPVTAQQQLETALILASSETN